MQSRHVLTGWLGVGTALTTYLDQHGEDGFALLTEMRDRWPFFATLLEKRYLEVVRPERGRFRAWLITAFKHFLLNEWKKAGARKRGGGQRPLSLDYEQGESRYRLEPVEDQTADGSKTAVDAGWREGVAWRERQQLDDGP